LKANHLIKSINNLLNEDAYSKFTLKQLYTKLGKEGLFKYIKDVCLVVARRKKIELLENMEFSSEDSYITQEEIFWAFRSMQKYYSGDLYLTYNTRLDKLDIQCGIVDCYDDITGRLSGHYDIQPSDVNVSTKVEIGILACSVKSGPISSKISEIKYRVKLDNESE
jgi:hypothetical protein